MENRVWYWVSTDADGIEHGAEPRSRLTDSRAQALGDIAEWGKEIVTNMVGDLVGDGETITARVTNGGMRWDIALEGIGSRSLTIQHTCAPNPIECSECHGDGSGRS